MRKLILILTLALCSVAALAQVSYTPSWDTLPPQRVEARAGDPGVADEPPQLRTLQGTVTAGDQPASEAVVYLKNTRTLAVKTFIADKAGAYRFSSLSPNVDYEVYAEQNGKRSDTKTLSSFDSRKVAYINLHIK